MAKSASLEIHTINVSQGDSVLIVNRDLAAVSKKIPTAKLPKDPIDWVPYAVANSISLLGTVKQALLVDGGEHQFGGNVVEYLETYGVLDPKAPDGYHANLSVVVSHYHDDHFAGLRSLLARRSKPKKGKPTTYPVLYRPAVIFQDARDKALDPPGNSFNFFQGLIKQAASPPSPTSTEVIELLPGGRKDPTAGPYEIKLGKGAGNIPIVAHVVASGRRMLSPVTGPIDVKPKSSTVNYNDRSIVLMLEYGSFRCLLGGDIAGNGGAKGGNSGPGMIPPVLPNGKKYKNDHADTETLLEPYLREIFPKTTTPKLVKGQPKFQQPGYATVLKANHHGSNSSVDTYFLATVQPLVFVVSSGVKKWFYNHPSKEVMYRVQPTTTWTDSTTKGLVINTIGGLYITEVAASTSAGPFNVNIGTGKIVGSTVVRPVDESILDIHNAGAFGTNLQVQVYGVGVSSDVTKSSKKLRPLQAGNGPGATYPIGPWTHSDKSMH